MSEVYPALQFVHILLFVYWLGTDLGVYLASRYVARADLSYHERQRFLTLLLALDMGPRTALVLVIPTGVLMISLAQWAPLSMVPAIGIALLSLGWLTLVWILYCHDSTSVFWRLLDIYIRVFVIIMMATFGFSILVGVIAEGPFWLGVKLIAYAGAVLCGLLLRRILKVWASGFKELQHPQTAEQGNKRIQSVTAASTRYALILWIFVLVAAWCGVVKPTGLD